MKGKYPRTKMERRERERERERRILSVFEVMRLSGEVSI